MPMKVEAAIVTQKRPSAEFNSDSINLNGKLFDRDVIKNGYKGSGVLSGNVYFALTSSDVEGFADAAVTAFNEQAENFAEQSPEKVLADYFSMCDDALKKTSHADAKLSAGCMYASGRKVVAACNGGKIYSLIHGVCASICSDKESNGCVNECTFPDVATGDIFILVSAGVADALSDKDIADICKVSDGSVKRIAGLISKIALSKAGSDAVSVIAVNIIDIDVDADNEAVGFVAAFPDNKAEYNAGDSQDEKAADESDIDAPAEEASEEQADNSSVAAEDLTENKNFTESLESKDSAETEDVQEDDEAEDDEAEDDEDDEDDEDNAVPVTKAKGAREKLLILLGAMVIVCVALIITVFVVRGVGSREEGTTEANETTTIEEITSDETTSEEETTDEETTDEETTEEEERTTEERTSEEERTSSRPAETTTADSTEATEPSSSEENTEATQPSEENSENVSPTEQEQESVNTDDQNNGNTDATEVPAGNE